MKYVQCTMAEVLTAPAVSTYYNIIVILYYKLQCKCITVLTVSSYFKVMVLLTGKRAWEIMCKTAEHQQDLQKLLSNDQPAFDPLDAVIKRVIDQLNELNSKNVSSKGAAELSQIDFSNISVPTIYAVHATIEVIDQLKAVEISGCSENTEQVADTDVHDVTFTLPQITSTPHAKPIRSSSHIIMHPNRYGTSNVRVVQKEKPKVYDDIKVTSLEDAIQMNMEYIKDQVLQDQGTGESELFERVQRSGVKRWNTSTDSEHSVSAANMCKEVQHVPKNVACKNIAQHHDQVKKQLPS